MNAVHREFLELAAAGIDFELSRAERARLDTHLATCQACPRRIAGLRSDDRALVDLPRFVLDSAVAERLQRRRRPAGGLGMLRMVAIGALVGLLALGSLAVGAELVRRGIADYLTVAPTEPAPSSPSPDRSSPSPDRPSPSPALPSPSPSEPVQVAWRSVGDVPALADAEVQAMSFDANFNVLALGCTVSPEGACEIPVAWRSVDGTDWSEPDVLPIDPAERAFRLTTVGRSGGRTFVGGSVRRDDVFHAAIWMTEDGVTWTRATPDPSFEGATVTSIVEFREGYVAVGSGLFTEPAGFRAWRSADGVAWTPVSEPPDEGAAYPTGVLELEEDSLLAWGPLGAVAPLGTTWWTSADGDAWELSAAPPGLDGASVLTIERHATGVVAHGWIQIESPIPIRWVRSFTSPEWTADAGDSSFDSPARYQLGVGHGTIVAGTIEPVGTVVWYRGPEEADWREAVRIPGVEFIALGQVPLDPARVVLVGRDGDSRSVVWTGAVDWTP
jgi:hypothetical protein